MRRSEASGLISERKDSARTAAPLPAALVVSAYIPLPLLSSFSGESAALPELFFSPPFDSVPKASLARAHGLELSTTVRYSCLQCQAAVTSEAARGTGKQGLTASRADRKSRALWASSSTLFLNSHQELLHTWPRGG